jgi:protein-tyrosine phosphatase
MNRLPRRWFFGLIALTLALAAITPVVGCGSTAVQPKAANVHWVKLENVANARDLGGWTLADGTRVPYGRVFRSGKLSNATAADLVAMRDLGIRASIDLRSTAEVRIGGRDPGGPLGLATTVSAPMAGIASEDGYRNMIDKQKSSIATAFRALADGSKYSFIIHCTAGKDRTGVMSALLLDLLGVSRPQIVDDYLLSTDTGAADPLWLEAALGEVDAAGGINKYLAGLGIDSSMQNAIKKNVLGNK